MVGLDNELVSVAVESVSVRGSGSVVEGRFAFWSADEIAAGDPVTPEAVKAVGPVSFLFRVQQGTGSCQPQAGPSYLLSKEDYMAE